MRCFLGQWLVARAGWLTHFVRRGLQQWLRVLPSARPHIPWPRQWLTNKVEDIGTTTIWLFSLAYEGTTIPYVFYDQIYKWETIMKHVKCSLMVERSFSRLLCFKYNNIPRLSAFVILTVGEDHCEERNMLGASKK